MSASVTRSGRAARRLRCRRTFVVGIVVVGNRAAYAVDAVALLASGTGLTSAGACTVATNAIDAVRIQAFVAEVARTTVRLLRDALVGVAIESASALRIERTGRQTRARLTRVRHARLLRARQTRAYAIAELRQVTRDEILARSRYALGRRWIVFTSGGTIAETSLAARRRAVRCAFHIRISARHDRRTKTITAIAFLQRGARFARIGAGFVAADAVNALPGRTFQSRGTRRAIGLRRAFATRTNSRFAIRTIQTVFTNVATLARLPAAIDVRFGSILDLIVALRGETNAIVAHAADAIAAERTRNAVGALLSFVDARTAAIDARFRSVLLAVHAARRLTDAAGANRALAIQFRGAFLRRIALFNAATTAIDIRFRSILNLIRTLRRRAKSVGADLARAVIRKQALLPRITTLHAIRTAAIDVRFLSV